MSLFEAGDGTGIEFGNPQLPTVDLAERDGLVLASYNFRYAVGRFLISSGLLRKFGVNVPRNRARAVQRNIESAARFFYENKFLPRPDILALQEADMRTSRAGGRHVAAELAQRLDTSYIHVAAGIPRGIAPQKREWWLNFEEQIGIQDAGDTGVAMLTRVPLENITRIDLPWHDCPWRPRLAMAATIRWRGRRICLINVHIDPHGPLDNQHQQIRRVLDFSESHDGPCVIMGDFNSLSKQKAVEIRSLMEQHEFSTPFATRVATWRGAGLRYHADWIFVRGVNVSRSGVAKPLNVSDHWPIWAEITPVAD